VNAKFKLRFGKLGAENEGGEYGQHHNRNIGLLAALTTEEKGGGHHNNDKECEEAASQNREVALHEFGIHLNAQGGIDSVDNGSIDEKLSLQSTRAHTLSFHGRAERSGSTS
jgi:hypothetical protein